MKKYTKDEVIESVKKELIKTNIRLKISDKLTPDDYIAIGIIREALKS